MKNSTILDGIGVIFYISLIIAFFAAFLTHWIVCIKAGAWVMLIAGSVVAPVGFAHGVASWLGYVWT